MKYQNPVSSCIKSDMHYMYAEISKKKILIYDAVTDKTTIYVKSLKCSFLRLISAQSNYN